MKRSCLSGIGWISAGLVFVALCLGCAAIGGSQFSGWWGKHSTGAHAVTAAAQQTSQISVASMPEVADGELLFFEASWCGACQAMKPIVAQLKSEGFAVRAMDVDEYPSQTDDYGIQRLPTFVLLRDGQEVRRASGVMSAEKLRDLWR